jgi:hypothetical protein
MDLPLTDADLTGNPLDCDDPTNQAVIGIHRDVLDTDCPPCVPSSFICMEVDCGTAYHPDCPYDPKFCGRCDASSVCVDNMCEPGNPDGNMYRCEGESLDTIWCMDLLKADSWTQVDASDWCDDLDSNTGVAIATAVDESLSCKNTVDQSYYIKRCNACEVDSTQSVPRDCIGRDYYLYMQAEFPDYSCTDYLAGSVVLPPWPAY